MRTTKYKYDILTEAYQVATQATNRAEDKIANAAQAEALVLLASQINDTVAYILVIN